MRLLLSICFLILATSQVWAGRCLPHNPNDSSAVAVCRTQYSNQMGCQSQSYFCYWRDGGYCAANDPNDSRAVAVCNTQQNEIGCRAQGYFCHWEN